MVISGANFLTTITWQEERKAVATLVWVQLDQPSTLTLRVENILAAWSHSAEEQSVWVFPPPLLISMLTYLTVGVALTLSSLATVAYTVLSYVGLANPIPCSSELIAHLVLSGSNSLSTHWDFTPHHQHHTWKLHPPMKLRSICISILDGIESPWIDWSMMCDT